MYFLEFLDSCILEKLTDRQRRIAMWRKKDIFGLGENEKSYREIASVEGLSAGRSQQITQTIIRKIKHRIYIIQQKMAEPQVIVKYIEKEETVPINLPIVYKSVHALGEMSVRTANCLHYENIQTIEQLVRLSEAKALEIPNFGRKSLNELRHLLATQNLRFGMEI